MYTGLIGLMWVRVGFVILVCLYSWGYQMWWLY